MSTVSVLQDWEYKYKPDYHSAVPTYCIIIIGSLIFEIISIRKGEQLLKRVEDYYYENYFAAFKTNVVDAFIIYLCNQDRQLHYTCIYCIYT